jgi:hypothetical protein
MKKINFILLSVILFNYILCTEVHNNTKAKINSNILLTAQQLSKAGFTDLDSLAFNMLIGRNNVYVMNSKDRIIARFTNEGKVDRVYKNHIG